MDETKLLNKLREMKKEAETAARVPYLDSYEEGIENGRADAFDDVIRMIEKSHK